jgi:hypothetical protein
MATAAMAHSKDTASQVESAAPARKKLKTTDLLLSTATRKAIDDLTYAFKKKGNYDSLRKQAWEALEASVCFESFVEAPSMITNSIFFFRISRRNSQTVC